MQRISKTKFVNIIQHLTDLLGGKPKMKDIANYLNEQNKFSSDLIAYYIKKYTIDSTTPNRNIFYIKNRLMIN